MVGGQAKMYWRARPLDATCSELLQPREHLAERWDFAADAAAAAYFTWWQGQRHYAAGGPSASGLVRWILSHNRPLHPARWVWAPDSHM